MVVAVQVVEHAEAERSAEALGPHGARGSVVAGAIDQDAQAADGMPLHAAQPDVGVVAVEVDEDAHAAQSRSLGHVLRLIGVVARDGRRASRPRAPRRPGCRAWCPRSGRCRRGRSRPAPAVATDTAAFAVDVVAAEVDDDVYVRHGVQLIRVLVRSTDDDVAGGRRDSLTHRAR